MLRKFVCAAVVLVLFSGVSLGEEKGEAKKKGKHVHGTFVKYEDGTLTIAVKKGEETTDKEFKVGEKVKVIMFDAEGEKTELTAGKDAEKITKTKKGTRIGIRLNDDDEVIGVAINPPKKKTKKEE